MPPPPAAPPIEPADDFVEVPLRPRFFEASAFFPMPIVLIATRGPDGAVNLAPYSLCFPSLRSDSHQLELLARADSKTAANLISTGRASVNFIPDEPSFLACSNELSAPVPTAEKMPKSVFHWVPSALPTGPEGAKAPEASQAPPPIVAEAVQAFECRLVRAEARGESDQHLLLEVERVRMQRYWARMLEAGRSSPRLPIDYGFRKSAASWTSRPVVLARGPRLRPEFVIQASRAPQLIVDDFRAALQRPDAKVTGKIRGEVLQLNIPAAEVDTWSPSMELSIEAAPEGSTIHARIGPLPQVWTTFMFVHMLVAMAGLGGLAWGLTQLFMGGEPWALAILAAALFLHAFVAGAAFVGQGLGAEQIYRLRTFVSDVLGP
jgi:flavin reductase (DIM6/NTAB) family NADH-FMN oxidoreductase RutF